jgi:hypothetical protein
VRSTAIFSQSTSSKTKASLQFDDSPGKLLGGLAEKRIIDKSADVSVLKRLEILLVEGVEEVDAGFKLGRFA